MEGYKMILAVFMSLLNIVKVISGEADFNDKKAEPARESVAVERAVSRVQPKQVQRMKLEVPIFVRAVPSGHFAGVSAPSNNLHEARRSAVGDVTRQILGTINVRYDHRYKDQVSGDARNPTRRVDDRLSKVSSGIVLDVERGIVRSVDGFDGKGQHMCFLLVKYSESKISEMRRLSRGSQLTAVLVSESDNGRVKLRLVEANDVAVTLSSADVKVSKKNNFAGVYNFCIWKVPKGSQSKFKVSFDPVRLRGDSRVVLLDFHKSEKGFGDFLLGASVSKEIKLHGVDEIGRKVAVTVGI